MSTTAVLLLALGLDGWLGEPRRLWSRLPHPIVLMGRLVAWADRKMNRGGPERLTGIVALCFFLTAAVGTGLVIGMLPGAPLWEVALAAILLAHRSLVDHVGNVATALSTSLDDGRRAVAQIVGRETAEMDCSDISRAAIESAAENLSDGVVAPAIWFLIAGLPGMLAYKMVNTADSMIGYRTDRHRGFGWASARTDDLMNLVPARLTALAIATLRRRLKQWPEIAADARQHRSPNAGWPEAAMARVLDLSLSGPRRYHGVLNEEPLVNAAGRADAGPRDIRAAIRVLWEVWLVLVLIVSLSSFLALMK